MNIYIERKGVIKKTKKQSFRMIVAHLLWLLFLRQFACLEKEQYTQL